MTKICHCQLFFVTLHDFIARTPKRVCIWIQKGDKHTTRKELLGKEVRIGSQTTQKEEKTTEKILHLMTEHPYITNQELAKLCGITEDGVYYNVKKMRESGLIHRVGGRKA